MALWAITLLYVMYMRHLEWMKDPYLQEVTASEPLSLSEEYEMQESWMNDPHKCTFLIKRVKAEAEEEAGSDVAVPLDLIGDINMFMHNIDDRSAAEIEVMIALPAFWRRGYGRLALCMMMRYGAEFLKITKFFAKISESNTSSIKLFER
jgi:RimJ/RimL family protein N-acetyltransferase